MGDDQRGRDGQEGDILLFIDEMKQAVLEELRYSFRPEFLNRVDESVVFHALSEEHLKQIVDIQLGRLRTRLAERHIQLEG